MTIASLTRAELEQRNKGMERELEKTHLELFKAQDKIKTLTDVVEEKKYTQQLAGWAIDRALETVKQSDPEKRGLIAAKFVIGMAEEFAKWVSETSAPIIANARKETLQ